MALDRQFALNIMLGAHALIFPLSGTQVKIGAPQGIELIYRDLFARGMSASAGGFFYPEIAGKTYINSWIRYGSPSFFGEFNFILWRESVIGETQTYKVTSKSVGLTFGFPVFQFL